MGMKYEMFAINLAPDTLYDKLMGVKSMHDYSQEMKTLQEHQQQLSQKFKELRKRHENDEISQKKAMNQFEKLMNEEPENEKLNEYKKEMNSNKPEKYYIWWRGVPDNDNWSFGGHTGFRGLKHLFDRRWVVLLLGIMIKANINKVFLIDYHHNQDCGNVEIYSDLQKVPNSQTLSSSENEKFNFSKFGKRVKNECDLPLNKIHTFLKNNNGVDWQYQVGSSSFLNEDSNEGDLDV